MTVVIPSLKNRRVLVMGFGLHGGGRAVTEWLVRHGAAVTVTDLRSAQQLQSSLDKVPLAVRKKIRWVLGAHRRSDIIGADILVQNPGVPMRSPYIRLARQRRIPIENDASLFFKYCRAPIIGVTGTRGKSTTAALIAHIFSSTEKRKKVWLVGLPDQPMMSIVEQIKPTDRVVVELSSWQLEILGEQHLSPHIAIVTSFFPDHLDRYQSLEKYWAAKAHIVAAQTNQDYALINYDQPATRRIGQKAPAQRYWFSRHFEGEQNSCFFSGDKIVFQSAGKKTIVAQRRDIVLPGRHNEMNVLAAVTAALVVGCPPTAIRSALTTFKGLPGRLEKIAIRKGVTFINDTAATMPEATVAALEATGGSKSKVILIIGGVSKNIPDSSYQLLAPVIKKTVGAAVCLAGNAVDQLKRNMSLTGSIQWYGPCMKMVDAVALAASAARPGDIILLSPAAASFNLFDNEFDRGRQFIAAVEALCAS